MQRLNGKELANIRSEQLKAEFALIREQMKRKPILAIIQVGDNPASTKYIENKIKKAHEFGIETLWKKYPENVRQRTILIDLDEINELADGIIVQLPLPEHLQPQVILDCVRLEKDLDGLNNRNQFNLYNNTDDFHLVPATALAIIDLLKYNNINLTDVKAAVVGRSNLVGRPTAFLLKREGANVSTYNKSSGIKGVESADLIISATGQAHLLSKENIKENAIVIDVGASWILDASGQRKIYGDVNTQDLEEHISILSPCTGGVGPVTVVSLFSNLAKALRHNNNI